MLHSLKKMLERKMTSLLGKFGFCFLTDPQTLPPYSVGASKWIRRAVPAVIGERSAISVDHCPIYLV
jgi:hypothetical protein